MGKAIAADINLSNQGTETNSKNVKFDVYLDENDRSVKEKTADINSEEVKLYVSVSVQGGGYLNNAQIELVDTNFRLANNQEITKFSLNSIQSDKGTTAGLSIVAKKDEIFNLNLFDMPSQIKLTGEYIDNDGNVKEIDTTKSVKIAWTLEELTDEDIALNQEVITNKVYNIDGVNKRVIQLLVSSKVQGNKAPVKSTTIEISNPEIGISPEEVKVVGYSTKATNGKTSLEFADGENSSWEYKEEEGKTYIQVLNKANEENIVKWANNGEDKFVVTYIYDESAEVLPFVCDVKSTLDIYGRTVGVIEKVNNIKLEELAEIGDIVKLENSITKNIYKGKMYIGEDTSYKVASNVYVPYSKIANTTTIQNLEDKALTAENEEVEGITTYYKETKINKADALKILGTEGTIKIYNADDKTNPIQEIVLSEENEEDYYTVSYDENVRKIAVELSKAKAEGIIEIENEKIVKISNTDVAKSLAELKSNTNITVTDVNNNTIVNSNNESTAKLVEPKTTFNVSLDKNSISALSENDVRITAELIAKNESNKLYKNPKLNIELPKDLKEVSIQNITPVVGNDELTLKSYNVVTNKAGNKVIVVEMQGEQKSYSANVATIVIDAKMKTDAFMANKNVEVKTTFVNDEEISEKVQELKIVAKSGLVTKSTVKVGETVVEKVNQNTINIDTKQNEQIEINTVMMNNYGDKLTSANIIGSIPEETTLKSAVTTNAKDAVVYYSEETNPSIDSENWRTDVASLDNIKSFKIKTPDLAQSAQVTVNYKYELNEKAVNDNKSTIVLRGTVDGVAKEETLTYVANLPEEQAEPQAEVQGETTNTEKLSVQVVTTAGGEEVSNGAEINNGQVLRYKVKVTNTSNETINNITIKPTIQNGKFYSLVEDGGTYYDGETGTMLPGHRYAEIENIANIKIESLEVGKTSVVEYQVVAYIGKGENSNQFKNDILITADNTDSLTINDVKPIKEGKIALKIHYTSNEEPVLYSNGDTKKFEVELINLTETNLENVPIKIDLPKELYCNLKDQMYFDTNKSSIDLVDNELVMNVYNLGANETKKMCIQLTTNPISSEQLETQSILVATSTFEGTTYTSNDYIRTIYQSETNLNAEFTSDKMGQILQLDDEITYTLTLTNNGILDTGPLYIYDDIQEGLSVKSIVVSKNNGENAKYTANNEGNIVIDDLEVGIGETITLSIVVKLDYILDDANEITNIIKVSGSSIDNIEKTLVNEVYSSNTDDDKAKTNNIIGLAWADVNKDGIRNNDEKMLEAIEVLLLDKDGKEVAKTTTSLAGTYKFDELEQGEYTVVFAYDTSKYAVTKYQVIGATESTNSDAISKQIEINGETKTVGATDTIKVDGKTINKDIDIGLIENAKFDLRLDKYISKVVLTNNSGTTTYEYEDTNFTKVEISARKIAGTTMVVEYKLQITNEGDVDGYIGDVIDYLPDGLVFTSETNKDWYMDENGVLHNKTLAEQVIKAGETKSVDLVLTKTLKSDSTGTIENIGEIGVSSNLEGIAEFDSTAGNNKTGEDDISTAGLIVSIATGSPMMYVGIVIGTMLVLGLGIYIINKKVLKVRI